MIPSESDIKTNDVKTKAICLMVIGNKYEKLYDRVKHQMRDYANKCDAEIVIIHEAPDKDFFRPLLSQKLLIPSVLRNYSIAVFLDLDILISANAPSVFDFLPADKAFGAVLDPRHTLEFSETWKSFPRIVAETTNDYFRDRNFALNDNLKGSINGGVFIFRPNDVAELFREYYFSDHNQGLLNSFEEPPMAYLTQVHNLFEPLPDKFNCQVLYKIKGTQKGELVIMDEEKIPRIFRKSYYRGTKTVFYPTKKYRKFIQGLISDNYFVHFAGSYPIPKII